ncbi:MAG: AbrB/MazE/SpoVT family DNA-binding domain-containing protein [Acutalibacteraceae bacterium]
MTTTIQKWGNSQGIRIPKYLLDEIAWTIDEVLSIEIKDNAIILKKKVNDYPKINLEKLFAEYQGDFPDSEYDWGVPQGEEVW